MKYVSTTVSRDIIHHPVGGHHLQSILDSDPANQILVVKMFTLATLRAKVVIMSRRASELALIKISPATEPTARKKAFQAQPKVNFNWYEQSVFQLAAVQTYKWQ